jgi:FkbM family methyltransferase
VIRRLMLTFGRQLRRGVLPLVGYWDIRRALEQQAQEIAAHSQTQAQEIAALSQLSHDIRAEMNLQTQKAQEIAAHSQTQAQEIAALSQLSHDIRAEINSRSDALSAQTTQMVRALQLPPRFGSVAELLVSEIDRLDGYLLYHATGLSTALNRMNNAARLFHTAVGSDIILLSDGYDIVVPTSEPGLVTYILRHGVSAVEPDVRAVIQKRLKPGAIAIDAGANIGLLTLTMATCVGPNGRVLCFEPLPHLADALSRTLSLNGFGERTEVQQIALADVGGSATLHRASHGPMSSLYPLPAADDAGSISVSLRALDDCIPSGSRVDFVKADVEGAEPRLWRGMRRILEENSDIEIVLEWSASHFRRSGEDPEVFMAEIRREGFSPFIIENTVVAGQLTPLREDSAALEASNLLLTRRPTTCK